MMQLPEDFEIDLLIELDEPDENLAIAQYISQKLGVAPEILPPFEIKRRAIDARHGKVRFLLTVGTVPTGEVVLAEPKPRAVQGAPVLIIGAGPAGLFCAYELARQGIASIIFDRGKMVQARRRDLKGLTQHGVVDSDSNYCFGEGGAGTYSDGKLYTRSHKRGDVRDVLEILVAHGAPENILTDARPHIGSNRLPKVITALREHLESLGVRFEFERRVVDICVDGELAVGVRLHDGTEVSGRSVVVATGHSARDMIDILARIGADLEAKPFAMGVRIEHPQPIINKIQYGRFADHPKLAAAPYRLAYTPEDGRGAFSFCMCPGGWIVPASTEAGELVVNGMSLSRRDSPYANSGLVVAITVEDSVRAGLSQPLGGIELQRRIERAAWNAGGGELCAPAVRATDFVKRRTSSTLPATSYEPGLKSADMEAILDSCGLPIATRLREALLAFSKKMPGYLCEEAVLVGVETRTSSPVRVLRDAVSFMSPSIRNLYPCGEGAGYAGGIVSAAMDGAIVARAIGKV
ncbi:MAG: NAD(P)/FAD-dependent oxidoreductase [Myxococcota bacterium]